jgi:CRP-like cAMP-binding protein
MSEMTDTGEPPLIDLVLTQSELGHLVGAVRQSVNRELSRLEDDGLIAIRGRSIQLLDPAGLSRRAGR